MIPTATNFDDPHDTIPLRSVRSLLKVAKEQGYDIHEVLRAAGFDFNPLTKESGALDEVPARLYSQLYKYLMKLLQDESFGLGIDQRQPPGTFRMFCLFIIDCSTLAKALERSAEFYDFCDSFHHKHLDRRKPYLQEAGSALTLVPIENPNVPESGALLASSVSALYMMYRFYSWLVGQNLPLAEVHLRGETPDNPEQYDQLFNCPVRFGKKHNGLLLQSHCLQFPNIQNEESLAAFLKTAPYPLISKLSDSDRSSLSSKVRALLSQDFSRESPTAEQVASQLHMSTRTLHRRLRQEEVSFQGLKDDCRRDAALAYISRPELTISAVAMLMGFQDASAFHRSFKKWTGMAPGEYRRQERNKQI